MTSLTVVEYVRKNLRDVDFFKFIKYFKYTKDEEDLANMQYTDALARLSKDADEEIAQLAKRKRGTTKKLRRSQLDDFWASAEVELAEEHFEKKIRCIQLKNQIVDAERHHSQFGAVSVVDREQTPEDVFRHPVSSDGMPSTTSKRLLSSEKPLPTDSKKPRTNLLDVSFDVDSSATTLHESSKDEPAIAHEGDIDDPLFAAIKSIIGQVRRHPSGDLSPMFYCVLDLRPPSLLGSREIRAANFLSEDHLKTVMEQAEVARSKLFDPPEAACKLLHILEQLSTEALVDLCGQMRIEGAVGLLKRLATLDAKVLAPRPTSLEELLDGSEHSNDAMMTTAEDLKGVSTEEEVQWIFHALDEIIRIVRSDFLATSLTERDVDVSLLKPFLDTLWDIVHLHYGEGESRASRIRRNDIEDKRRIGSKFDWLLSCYSSFPDDIRGIELGIGENSGPTHVDGTEKVSTDLVKVIKAARDQLSQIIRIVQNEYGSDHLSESLIRGIKALFIVALHVVGFQVHVHVVYYIGGNVFAVSELGCSRLPHSLESIHTALDMCHLILRTKALVSRSIKFVDALLLEARRSRKLPTAAFTKRRTGGSSQR